MSGPAGPTLQGLLKKPGNNVCADCKANAPRWASTNLGVFICIDCSGIHRDLGTHITKIKSVTLDEWAQENVDLMAAVGNNVANAYYEYALPSNYKRVTHADGDRAMNRFIESKYSAKKWIPPGSVLSPAEKYSAGGDPLSTIPNDKRPAKPSSAPTLNPEPPKPRTSRTKGGRRAAGVSKTQRSSVAPDSTSFPQPPPSWTQVPQQSLKTADDPSGVINPPKQGISPTTKKNLLEDFWSEPQGNADYANFNAPTPPSATPLSSQPPVATAPTVSSLNEVARPYNASHFDLFSSPFPSKQTKMPQNTVGTSDLQALGYTLEPPTPQRVQEAKINAAKEAQEAVLLDPSHFGFGEPHFPPVNPAPPGTVLRTDAFRRYGVQSDVEPSWENGMGGSLTMNMPKGDFFKHSVEDSSKAPSLSTAITSNLAALATLGAHPSR